MTRLTHSRTDIQTVAFFLGNPPRIQANELLDKLNKRVTVESLSKVRSELDQRDIEANIQKLTGRAIRAALLFIRRMFMSGRKSVILPLASL